MEPNGIDIPVSAASLRPTKRVSRVELDFRGQRYTFRVTRGLTFAQLLEEAARHWNLEAEDFELRDLDECIWPGSANVEVELSDETGTDGIADDVPIVFVHSHSAFSSRPVHRDPATGANTISSPQLAPQITPPGSPSTGSIRLGNFVYNLPASPGPTGKAGLSVSAGSLPPQAINLGSSPSSAAIHALEKKRQTDEPRLPPSASEEVRKTLQLNNVCVPPQTDSGATTPRSRSISHNSSTDSLGSLVPPPSTNGKRPIKLLRENGEMCVSEVVENSEIQHTPTSHKVIRLVWEHPPQTVLVIKKHNEPAITEIVRELAKWLKVEKNIDVLVEPEVQRTELQHLQTYSPDDLTALAKKVDLVLCLGGDGTVLHANSLFQESTPPVMAFNLGSLGFLTPFRIRNYKRAVNTVMSECYLTLRSRLFCVVVRTNPDGTEEISKHSVLNEVVIDRGSSPYLSNLECFCDDLHVTTIQADGIIVGTTTGSTAYSLSAGGSMVHPQVPAILFTPICPHSLSFRPILFPDAAELKIQVPKDARSSAWASFDGRYRTELHKNDYIIIRISRWPFVWVNKSDTVQDWFKSLAECLHWNERQKQK